MCVFLGDRECCFHALFEEFLVLYVGLVVVYRASIVRGATYAAVVINRNIVNRIRNDDGSTLITEESRKCLRLE